MADLDALLADLTSGDEARAQAAAPALTVHGDQAIARLRQLLDSPVSDRRWWAAYALSIFDQPDARAGLILALDDSDASVRQCAALGLRISPTASAIAPLTARLGDADRLTARLAADALAAIGGPAVPALAEAAKGANPQVRIEAVRALADMRLPEAIGPLFEALEDQSSVVGHWAEEGLERLGIGMSFFNP